MAALAVAKFGGPKLMPGRPPEPPVLGPTLHQWSQTVLADTHRAARSTAAVPVAPGRAAPEVIGASRALLQLWGRPSIISSATASSRPHAGASESAHSASRPEPRRVSAVVDTGKALKAELPTVVLVESQGIASATRPVPRAVKRQHRDATGATSVATVTSAIAAGTEQQQTPAPAAPTSAVETNPAVPRASNVAPRPRVAIRTRPAAEGEARAATMAVSLAAATPILKEAAAAAMSVSKEAAAATDSEQSKRRKVTRVGVAGRR